MTRPKTDQQAIRCTDEHLNDQQFADEQVAAIKSFIEGVGGIENARQALLALTELDKAA